MIEAGQVKRAGLLATQGIRGGANRETLNRIKQKGDIFFAVSDREWILDGAAVHISMVGFDNGTETNRSLDGQKVGTINANLTSTADITQAQRLTENMSVGFMGDTKGGSFDIPYEAARTMLDTPNVNRRPSSDVVTPWCNGLDVTRRNREMWIIDFGTDLTEATARLFEKPFAHALVHVFPDRQNNKRESYRVRWWLHVEARSGMRGRLAPLKRFLVTPNLTKHRLFMWMSAPTLPDHQLIAFARSDDYFFGVLHSRIHQLWSLRMGTQLETRPRYTPTTCFETFPFPEPTETQREVIATAAKELDSLRNNWLNPAEWTKTEILEFPGAADGPWKRYVEDVDPSRNVGTVRYPRNVPKNSESAVKLKARTLTNLYNESPAWLKAAHKTLDEAVFTAYGWPADVSDDDLLAKLLALNLSRAGAESAGETESEPDD